MDIHMDTLFAKLAAYHTNLSDGSCIVAVRASVSHLTQPANYPGGLTQALSVNRGV